MPLKYTNLNENILSDKNKTDQSIKKTTNVNILLNRVKQDKKNIFKKKLLFSLLLITLISLLAILFNN